MPHVIAIPFENRIEGIMQLVELVRSKCPNEKAIAVVESTANYWNRIHDLFEENGINAFLANPAKALIIAEARLKDDKHDEPFNGSEAKQALWHNISLSHLKRLAYKHSRSNSSFF